jgi:hypothetical protein
MMQGARKNYGMGPSKAAKLAGTPVVLAIYRESFVTVFLGYLRGNWRYLRGT